MEKRMRRVTQENQPPKGIEETIRLLARKYADRLKKAIHIRYDAQGIVQEVHESPPVRVSEARPHLDEAGGFGTPHTRARGADTPAA